MERRGSLFHSATKTLQFDSDHLEARYCESKENLRGLGCNCIFYNAGKRSGAPTSAGRLRDPEVPVRCPGRDRVCCFH